MLEKKQSDLHNPDIQALYCRISEFSKAKLDTTAKRCLSTKGDTLMFLGSKEDLDVGYVRQLIKFITGIQAQVLAKKSDAKALQAWLKNEVKVLKSA